MAAPSVVNTDWALVQDGNTSVTVSFSGWTTAAGNGLAVLFTNVSGNTQNWGSSSIKLSNGSGGFTEYVNTGTSGNVGNVAVWVNPSIPGGCTSLTVTLSAAPTEGRGFITVMEVANLDPASPIGPHASGAGAGSANNADSGFTGNTTRGNAIFLGVAGVTFSVTASGGIGLTGPGGWTTLGQHNAYISTTQNEFEHLAGYFVASGIQSPHYKVTWTLPGQDLDFGATAAILVLNGTLPNINNTSLPFGVVGTAYSQTLTASNGVGPYTWAVTAGSLPPGLTLSSGGTISGTPTSSATYSFTVTVTDSAGGTDSQALSIHTYPTLTISTTSVPAGYQNSAYSVNLSASGGSGTGYSWSVSSGSLPPGVSLSGAGTLSGTPTTPGTYSFTAQVTDSLGLTATQSLSVVIESLVSITTSSLPSGEALFTYTTTTLAATGGTGSGYTWSIITGSLPAGLSFTSGGVLSGTPTASGTFPITIQVVDSASHSATKNYSLVISPFALAFSPSSLPTGTTGTAYSQTITASAGTAPYTYVVSVGALPGGLALSSGGVLSGTPTATGTFSFTITATDSASRTGSRAYTLAIYAPITQTTSSPLPYGVTSTAYSQALAYTGGSGSNTWSITAGSLPPGLSLSTVSGSNGLISGTPTTPGSYSFTATVTDTAGHSTGKAFTMTVYAGVTVTTASLPNGYETVAYNQTLAASGGSGSGYVWSIVGGSLGDGLSMSSAGVITGTPLISQTQSFTVQVVDSVGITTTKSFSIVIRYALQVTTASLPQGTGSVAYSATLAATGGSGTGYSWTITSGTLPTGLSLSTAGVLSGTTATTGTTSLTFKVTDSASNSATQALTLVIAPPPPSITTTTIPSGTVGRYYSFTLAATGGVTPYAWSVTQGSLPPGLILDGAAILGNPSEAGTWSFTVTVTDSNNQAASTSF